MFEAGFSPERLTAACERAVHGDQERVLQHLAEEAARILDYLFKEKGPSKTKPSAETD
jgi:predicted transglutaminase-like cysteine proteinase